MLNLLEEENVQPKKLQRETKEIMSQFQFQSDCVGERIKMKC